MQSSCRIHFFLQEAEAEALGQAPEVESEKEEEQPQESDGSSSSEEMFGFGLQSSKGKKVVRSKPSGNGTSRKSTAVAKPQQTTDPEASIMAKAKDTLEILEKVCPLAVWQGSMKEKDVDAKLNKGLGIAGQISSSLEASDECKSLGSKLEKSAEEITETLGVLSTMKTKINAISGDGNATALACEESVLNKVISLPSDCLTAMLTAAGKNLAEVRDAKSCLTNRFATRLFHIPFHLEKLSAPTQQNSCGFNAVVLAGGFSARW